MKAFKALLLAAFVLTGGVAQAQQMTPQHKAAAQAQLAAAQKQVQAMQAQVQAQQAAQQRAQQQAAQQQAQQQAQLRAQQQQQQLQAQAQAAQQRAQQQAAQQQAQAQQAAQQRAQQQAQAAQAQQKAQQAQSSPGSYKGVAIRAGSDADIQAQMRAVDASQAQAQAQAAQAQQAQLAAQQKAQAQQQAQATAQAQAQAQKAQQLQAIQQQAAQLQAQANPQQKAQLQAIQQQANQLQAQAQRQTSTSQQGPTNAIAPGVSASSKINAAAQTQFQTSTPQRTFGAPASTTSPAAVKPAQALASARQVVDTVGNTAIAYGQGTASGLASDVNGAIGFGRSIQNGETFAIDHPQQAAQAVASAAQKLTSNPVGTVASGATAVSAGASRTFGQISQTLQSTDPTVIARGLGSTVEAGAILGGGGEGVADAVAAKATRTVATDSIGGVAAAVRPTWQQSELDVGQTLGSSYSPQVSYKAGNVVSYGSAGSVRPDFSNAGAKTLVEVKNYDVGQSASSLTSSIVQQSSNDAAQLPGWKQTFVVDIRGQDISDDEKNAIRSSIVAKTSGRLTASDIIFKQ